MRLCNWEPSLSTHNHVIVLAWLTRLTEALITSGLASTVVFVMSSILIPIINLALDHSDGLLRAEVEKLKLASRFVLQI